MASDEQRREAAKELRELATAGCIRYAEEFYEELREIVAFDSDGSFDGVADSLADLIDRGECENVYDESAYGPCDNGFNAPYAEKWFRTMNVIACWPRGTIARAAGGGW